MTHAYEAQLVRWRDQLTKQLRLREADLITAEAELAKLRPAVGDLRRQLNQTELTLAAEELNSIRELTAAVEAERKAAEQQARAEQAETTAAADRDSCIAAYTLLEERTAERNDAQDRILRALVILGQPCQTEEATALRTELLTALHACGPELMPAIDRLLDARWNMLEYWAEAVDNEEWRNRLWSGLHRAADDLGVLLDTLGRAGTGQYRSELAALTSRGDRYRLAWQSARRHANEYRAAVDTLLDESEMGRLVADTGEQLDAAAATIDAAYRERAHLTAWLATLHPAVLAPAPDIDEPGWQILYLTAGGRQLSWHIHPRDAGLYLHVPHVTADDPRAQWDGHTTEAKYAAIAQLCTDAAFGPPLPSHDSRVWEDEDGWHASCWDCPAEVENIGGEDDAGQWAAEHKAAAAVDQCEDEPGSASEADVESLSDLPGLIGPASPEAARKISGIYNAIRSGSGISDGPPVITLPPQPVWPGPIVAQPCTAPGLGSEEAKLATTLGRLVLLAHDIDPAWPPLYFTYGYGRTETIAAHPHTVWLLNEAALRLVDGRPGALPTLLGISTFGVFCDDTIPPAEIRLRPAHTTEVTQA
ncbi:hypothetical protein BX265_4979 [Streptomyces sp. TLI_235]|nr:hypothetical protein [Streptomyces sp. TLI_235]PBC80143.1 hypothetical protein BX265_4979 [Streptomyces sp. TLI_235]